MTLYEFNALDEMEQAEAVWDSVHVTDRRDEEHNIILYQRGDFYIEVFYHRDYMAKIFSGKYLETAEGTPTFLNVGGKYPDAQLTLVIWGDVRKQFKNAPEDMYTGHDEWITGKIELYKGKPEIVIHSTNQIYDVVAAPIGKNQ